MAVIPRYFDNVVFAKHRFLQNRRYSLQTDRPLTSPPQFSIPSWSVHNLSALPVGCIGCLLFIGVRCSPLLQAVAAGSLHNPFVSRVRWVKTLVILRGSTFFTSNASVFCQWYCSFFGVAVENAGLRPRVYPVDPTASSGTIRWL